MEQDRAHHRCQACQPAPLKNACPPLQGISPRLVRFSPSLIELISGMRVECRHTIVDGSASYRSRRYGGGDADPIVGRVIAWLADRQAARCCLTSAAVLAHRSGHADRCRRLQGRALSVLLTSRRCTGSSASALIFWSTGAVMTRYPCPDALVPSLWRISKCCCCAGGGAQRIGNHWRKLSGVWSSIRVQHVGVLPRSDAYRSRSPWLRR